MKKKSSQFITLIIIVVTLLTIINIVMAIRQVEYSTEINQKILSAAVSGQFSQKQVIDLKACPTAVGGNNESFLKMKYFYTTSCPWCKKEEKVIKKLLAEQGSLFFVEWYNLAYCKDIAATYKVTGVPTFVFSTDLEAEQVRYGYIPQKDLKQLICSVSGGC